MTDVCRDRSALRKQLAKQHCMHAEQGQPLLWPDRAADDPSQPYAYWLCVVRTDRAPGAGGAAQRAGAGAPDPPEEDLPAHMYWRWCSGKGQWLPCVHVRWFRSQVRGGLVFNKQANGGVAWCHEIPPVVLAGWQQWQAGGGSTTTVSSEADTQIRQLNLLRFSCLTQQV